MQQGPTVVAFRDHLKSLKHSDAWSLLQKVCLTSLEYGPRLSSFPSCSGDSNVQARLSSSGQETCPSLGQQVLPVWITFWLLVIFHKYKRSLHWLNYLKFSEHNKAQAVNVNLLKSTVEGEGKYLIFFFLHYKINLSLFARDLERTFKCFFLWPLYYYHFWR